MNILIALNLVKMHFGSNEPDGRQARMLPRIASFAPAAMAFVPRQAWAHIKWFAPYDVTAQPAPVDVVLSTHFVLVLLGFGILVFAGFFFDRLLATRSRRLTGKLLDTDLGEVLMRAGIGGFFMALFVTGGMILTPELHTDAEWIGWVQLGITISLLSRWTCVLGGAGILILYSYGIAQYGVFHMVDYPMFPGIAAYLVLTSNMSERLRSVRMPILTVSVCTGLMWGAIEKFAYPQWTIPLLEARPYLTMGVAPKDVMIIAGFIEFSLAFYIMTGFALVRLAILGLIMIFAAAILDFGMVDAIGHLPILVPLIAMFLHGPNLLHRWFYDASAGFFVEASRASATFATSLCLLFAVYYAIQSAEYGPARHHLARLMNAAAMSVHHDDHPRCESRHDDAHRHRCHTDKVDG